MEKEQQKESESIELGITKIIVQKSREYLGSLLNNPANDMLVSTRNHLLYLLEILEGRSLTGINQVSDEIMNEFMNAIEESENARPNNKDNK